MSKILNIDQLKELAQPTIEIPGFDKGQTIFVKVKKPSVLKMLASGEMPNHLLGTAQDMVGIKPATPKKKTAVAKEEELERYKEITNLLELYCRMCLIEPSFEEFKEIMTDEQKEAIFDWGMGGMADANKFHTAEKVQPDNNDGEKESGKSK